jgi:uncharacterized RDD family membrane protein YckC
MTMTADDYIARVLSRLPGTTPRRDQIALELRSHIAERVEHGQALDAVLDQLGDPERLAESYLAEVRLDLPPHPARVWAKLVDIALVEVAVAIPAALVAVAVRAEARPFVLAAALALGGLGFLAYSMVAEYRYGRTVGKYLAGLHVVRESGAPISIGQAIVRHLPLAFQFFWIDVLFAFLTERRQRAFELLSKTRVVRV